MSIVDPTTLNLRQLRGYACVLCDAPLDVPDAVAVPVGSVRGWGQVFECLPCSPDGDDCTCARSAADGAAPAVEPVTDEDLAAAFVALRNAAPHPALVQVPEDAWLRAALRADRARVAERQRMDSFKARPDVHALVDLFADEIRRHRAGVRAALDQHGFDLPLEPAGPDNALAALALAPGLALVAFARDPNATVTAARAAADRVAAEEAAAGEVR